MMEEYNYDPWGRRRNQTNWSYSNVQTPTYTQHGFTGHEHLDMFNLIHMNGRIYDSEIARFLSPDPIIQDPYNLLNYNRYSYCLNNPLKYVDPSGYKILGWFTRFIKRIFGSDTQSSQDNVQDNEDQSGGGGNGDYKGPTYNIEGVTIRPKTLPTFNYRKPDHYNEFKNTNQSGVDDPIDYFISSYGKKPRAGDIGVISPNNKEFMNGVAGFFDLASVAAQKVQPMPGVANTGGILISSINIINIVNDMNNLNQSSYGDQFRLLLNIIFIGADAFSPFVGFGPSLADSYGLFEYGYHQMDVFEETGNWVYFNWYTKKWVNIKIRR